MANIVTFVNDLDSVLTDGTTGVNAHLNTIKSSAPQLEDIWSTFDLHSLDDFISSPALLAHHQGIVPTEGGQGLRDWTHEVLFKYRYRDPGPESRRKAAGWTLHALLRSISPKDGLPTTISGIQRVNVVGATTDLWDVNDRHEDILLMARVEFDTREQL